MRAFGEDQRWASQSFVAVEPTGHGPVRAAQRQGRRRGARTSSTTPCRCSSSPCAPRSAAFDLDTAEGRVQAHAGRRADRGRHPRPQPAARVRPPARRLARHRGRAGRRRGAPAPRRMAARDVRCFRPRLHAGPGSGRRGGRRRPRVAAPDRAREPTAPQCRRDAPARTCGTRSSSPSGSCCRPCCSSPASTRGVRPARARVVHRGSAPVCVTPSPPPAACRRGPTAVWADKVAAAAPADRAAAGRRARRGAAAGTRPQPPACPTRLREGCWCGSARSG